MAKQEDHDDLAEIFNKQSEVLTQQFGEFFIAELIAYQNENQKALVAQVGEKAVGLMSISKDIDYKLLAEGFELDQYDNLLSSEFMEAIKDRKDEIVLKQQYEDLDRRREAAKKILEEKMLTSYWGQRIALQQHMRAKEQQFLQDLEFYMAEENNKNLTREGVEKILDEWLAGFKLTQPGDIFFEEGVKDPEVNCWVISERNFFLETLVYFGLPKDYIQGNGHWHDWAYNKLLERKQLMIRKRPTKKPQAKRGRVKMEEKKEEEVKEPEYFDLVPLQKALAKFIATGPEMRTLLRSVIIENLQKFVFIFSNQNGELMKGRNIDVTELGDYMKENGINFPQTYWEHIASILDCFGDLKFDKLVTEVMPQDEKAKREELKDVKSAPVKKAANALGTKESAKKGAKDKGGDKDKEKEKDQPKEQKEKEPKDFSTPVREKTDAHVEEQKTDNKSMASPDPKSMASPDPKSMASPDPKKEVDVLSEKYAALVRPNQIIEIFSSYEEILEALDKIRAFDQMMVKLGVIKADPVKDAVLKNEVAAMEEKEAEEREEELKKRERDLPENQWRTWCEDLTDLNALPDIPIDVHNAIAINLFCIDEKYESRSIDFLEYAFSLFPDRDYIILTQPHIVHESLLLQSFIQIPKKKNAIFDDVLYIFHKDAFLASLIAVKISPFYNIMSFYR